MDHRSTQAIAPASTRNVPLPAELWTEIQDRWSRHVYPPSVSLLEQGAQERTVYFVESGIVKLFRGERTGRRVVIGLRYAGHLVGTHSAVLEQAAAFTAETLTRCTVRQTSAEAFRRLVRGRPDLSWHIHCLHSREVTDHVLQLASLGGLSAERRLERLLLQLVSVQTSSSTPNGEIRLAPVLKRAELAEAIVATPQHLSRLIRKLEQQHKIRREKGWLILMDADWLRAATEPRRLDD